MEMKLDLKQETKPDIYIFDIDGTLSDNSNRLYLAEEGRFNDYNEMAIYDKPIESLVSLCRELLRSEKKVLLLTGREEKHLELTKSWINKYIMTGHSPRLRMRKNGERTTNVECKKRILMNDILPNFNVICAFDDNPEVVKMYRALGIHCLQVKKL